MACSSCGNNKTNPTKIQQQATKDESGNAIIVLDGEEYVINDKAK